MNIIILKHGDSYPVRIINTVAMFYAYKFVETIPLILTCYGIDKL